MDGFCFLYLLLILLVRSGDVETNPGPNAAESTVSEMEFLKLARDIPPSYYEAVGISLGIPYAQLQAILSEKLKNYTNALLDVFVKWNVMQQPPHTNRRQLLGDKLREIELGGLSDRILNKPPISNSTDDDALQYEWPPPPRSLNDPPPLPPPHSHHLHQQQQQQAKSQVMREAPEGYGPKGITYNSNQASGNAAPPPINRSSPQTSPPAQGAQAPAVSPPLLPAKPRPHRPAHPPHLPSNTPRSTPRPPLPPGARAATNADSMETIIRILTHEGFCREDVVKALEITKNNVPMARRILKELAITY